MYTDVLTEVRKEVALRERDCVFHAIRPLNPSASGHWFHDDPATLSTAIRPGRAERSDAGKGRYADWADGVNRCFFRMDSPSIVSL